MILHFRQLIMLWALAVSIAAMSIQHPSSHAQDTEHTLPVMMEWSPDGTMIAIGYENGEVRVIDSTTKDLITSHSIHSEHISSIAWHPQNEWLASSGYERQVVIYHLDSDTFIEIPFLPIGRVDAIAWSPDGSQIAVAQNYSDMQNFNIWDVRQQAFVHSESTPFVSYLLWNDMQDHLAVLHGFSAIEIRDADTFTQTAYLGLTVKDVRRIQNEGNSVYITSIMGWNADSSMIITGSLVREVAVWDIAQPEPIMVVDATDTDLDDVHNVRVYAVWFDDDNNSFGSVSGDGTYRAWVLASGELVQESKLAETVFAPAISHNKESLAYFDEKLKLQIKVLSELD